MVFSGINRVPLEPLWRRILHIIILLVGWIVYFVFLFQLRNVDAEILISIAVLILAFSIIIPSITYIWIRHKRIFDKTHKAPEHPNEILKESKDIIYGP
jgi:hypothetical protein